jgi:hypothetical protein
MPGNLQNRLYILLPPPVVSLTTLRQYFWGYRQIYLWEDSGTAILERGLREVESIDPELDEGLLRRERALYSSMALCLSNDMRQYVPSTKPNSEDVALFPLILFP